MTPPATPQPQPQKISSIGSPRFWVVYLWAFAVSGGFGIGYWSYQFFQTQADLQMILLVPDQPLDDQRRSELAIKLGAEPSIASAAWIAPADQAQRLQSQFPDERWKETYPADPNWLPWVLEVKPADPLGNRDLLTAFIANRRQEGGWQVYWDGSTLDTLIHQRKFAAIVLLSWIVVIFLAGIAALSRLPKHAGLSLGERAAGLVVFVICILALSVFQIMDAAADTRAFFIAGFSGLILAVIAPIIGQRRIPLEPPASTFSTTVAEAPDERVR